jgi:putative transposase
MRYADGGGLTARERDARERVRGQAADMFEQDLAATEIAARLRATPSLFARGGEAGP